MRACKRLIQGARTRAPAQTLPAEREAFLDLFDTEDQREGVAAFLGKRRAAVAEPLMREGTDAPVLFDTLRTASGHAFGRATLNAPAILNALSLAMIDLLDAQLTAWAEDPEIAGVVLDGAGDRAFCAGGDVVRV